ncbi:MAG: rod shape-determining protein MreC [Candidatus Komeilibacteria bacterium]
MPIKRSQSRVTVLVAVIILLLFFQYLGWFRPLTNFLGWLWRPIQQVVYSVSGGTYDWFSNIASSQRLAEENESLRQSLTQLQLNQLDLVNIKAENIYLRQQLDFISNISQSAILANIIGKPLWQNDFILIDKGAADGLEPGLPVLAGDGILVGTIYRVDEYKAQVALLTNTKSSVAATVGTSNNTQGVVQGNMGLGLLMDMIPLSADIKVGDLVYSSGLEDKITDYYLIGQVSSLLHIDNDLYQRAEVVPSFDYKNLRILTIILQP